VLAIVRSAEPLGLDQGLFACFGRWIPDGALPYRDLFDSKPPLHLYTWVLAWLGGTPASAWWFEVVWLLASGALAFVLGRRVGGRWVGLAIAMLLVAGVWLPGFGGYWSRLQAEELLVLPELAAAWFALRAVDKSRAALWCGVLTGAVGLYKIPALAIGAAWLALWLASVSRRDALVRLAWFAGGVAAPWLVVSAWFAAHGAFGIFISSIVFYQRHWIAQIDPPWGDVIDQFIMTGARVLWVMWLAAFVGIAFAWRRNRQLAIMLAVWVVACAVAIIMQRQLAGYHFLLLVPSLAVAAGYGLVALTERALWLGAIAIAIVALVTVRDLASYRGEGDSREVYLRSMQKGTFKPAEEEEVVRYLSAHTKPGDGVLVWALAPGIYALADRHPVTRFPFHRLLLTDSKLSRAVPGLPARRAALLARMRADPPAYVVIGTNDSNPFETDSVSSLFAFSELSQIVLRDYHEETRIGHFVVLAKTR